MSDPQSMQADLFSDMTRRYQEHDLPWDRELPPPEVIDLAATLAPGRALDLGCGAGRACIYLARHGWRCDGVDFVPRAIELARTRAEAAGVADRTQFYVAPVTQLDFLRSSYDLILDVGCLHAQPSDALGAYAQQILRLLQPGGSYVLFAHLADEQADGERRWIAEDTIPMLFTPALTIERIERGNTTVGDATWPSAWFWMRRIL